MIAMSSLVPIVEFVLLLLREYVVDGSGGYVEVDLDPCLAVAIDLIVLPLNKEGGVCQSRYVVSADVLMQTFLDLCCEERRAVVLRRIYSSAAVEPRLGDKPIFSWEIICRT